MTASMTRPPGVGGLLRDWRQRRHLSQLDLALTAQVSARHLSFVETGRSRPSPELVIHLAEHLEVPLRDRNALLLAAGYAPTYTQTPLEAREMSPIRSALDKIVRGHEPFPALVADRRWDVVTTNAPGLALMSEGVARSLLAPPVNVLRLSLHPDGLAPRIVNFAEWSEHLMERLDRQIATSQEPGLTALAAELRTLPGVGEAGSSAGRGSPDLAHRLFVPLVLRRGDQELRFVSTVSTFGTALDITVAELVIESFFPADDETATILAAG
jgi:transcriptional regulator with XRE-family HTH domain